MTWTQLTHTTHAHHIAYHASVSCMRTQSCTPTPSFTRRATFVKVYLPSTFPAARQIRWPYHLCVSPPSPPPIFPCHPLPTPIRARGTNLDLITAPCEYWLYPQCQEFGCLRVALPVTWLAPCPHTIPCVFPPPCPPPPPPPPRYDGLDNHLGPVAFDNVTTHHMQLYDVGMTALYLSDTAALITLAQATNRSEVGGGVCLAMAMLCRVVFALDSCSQKGTCRV
jgi:hypothetical protein